MLPLEGLGIESRAMNGKAQARRAIALKAVGGYTSYRVGHIRRCCGTNGVWISDPRLLTYISCLRRVARAALTQAGSQEGVLNRSGTM